MERAELEKQFGTSQVWNTDELQEEFSVIGFMAPFVTVKDKKTGKTASMEFQHMPRFYFDLRWD